MPQKIILISGSLNTHSHTKIVVDIMADTLRKKKAHVEVIDLATLEMEFCDGRELEKYSTDLQEAYQKIEASNGVIIGMPVYCYSVSGPLKNFIDITSQAFREKSFGILCNAGSSLSYLASNDLMKILSFESFAFPLSPTVMTSGADFKEGKLINERALKKIEVLAGVVLGKG